MSVSHIPKKVLSILHGVGHLKTKVVRVWGPQSATGKVAEKRKESLSILVLLSENSACGFLHQRFPVLSRYR
jgi:hypothetical protein